MKKTVWIIAASMVVMIVFAACAGEPGQPNGDTIMTTTPTVATNRETQPTEPVDYTEYTNYNATPKTCIMVRYEDGKDSGDYVYPGKEFSTAGMKDGGLYIVHDGEVYPVTQQYVTERIKTSEHIYYVLKEDAKKVWRTDLYGKEPTVVYESAYGDVTYLQYFGIDAKGKLIMAENRERIIMYDLQAKNIEVLMEAYLISQFYYSPSGQEFSCSEPMIFWKGKLEESAPETEYTYHYFLNTEKQVQIYPQ